jgi:hypothetical protein
MGRLFAGTFRFMFPVAGAWTPLLIFFVWPLSFSLGMVWLMLLAMALIFYPFALMLRWF